VGKKLPEVLETLLTPDVVKGRHVRLMFQDEARFGRMVRIRRCWAPAPHRPVVDNGYEREFQYVYGAVSPLEGELDWRIGPVMNTEQMGTFLAQVSAAHPEDFIVMVVDGASSHVAKALVVPENIRLHRLPGYSPELNPQEHLWDELREKEFPNRVFSDMAGVVRTLATGLKESAQGRCLGCHAALARQQRQGGNHAEREGLARAGLFERAGDKGQELLLQQFPPARQSLLHRLLTET
jgi:hypothetical protein